MDFQGALFYLNIVAVVRGWGSGWFLDSKFKTGEAKLHLMGMNFVWSLLWLTIQLEGKVNLCSLYFSQAQIQSKSKFLA